LLEVLTGSNKYYSKMEKMCYAVILSVRKLRHYFEAHTIKVLTNQPLNDIVGNRDSSGRISKWSMELLECVIDFKKRSAIKSQILADFLAEWMEPSSPAEGIIPESPWLLYCNGGWGHSGASVAALLISPSRIKLCYVARLQLTNGTDKCTNNITKYKVVMLGIHKLRAISVQTCLLHTDSKVMEGKIEKECIAREATLEKYLSLVPRMGK
jgi:hypothetical protein